MSSFYEDSQDYFYVHYTRLAKRFARLTVAVLDSSIRSMGLEKVKDFLEMKTKENKKERRRMMRRRKSVA